MIKFLKELHIHPHSKWGCICNEMSRAQIHEEFSGIDDDIEEVDHINPKDLCGFLEARIFDKG